MLLIRALTERDIDFVVAPTQKEGWGYLRSDIMRCLECEPDGCFIAERDAQIVGHVFSISYGRLVGSAC